MKDAADIIYLPWKKTKTDHPGREEWMKNRNTGTKQTSRDKNFPHPVLTSYFKIDTINYYHKDVIN